VAGSVFFAREVSGIGIVIDCIHVSVASNGAKNLFVKRLFLRNGRRSHSGHRFGSPAGQFLFDR